MATAMPIASGMVLPCPPPGGASCAPSSDVAQLLSAAISNDLCQSCEAGFFRCAGVPGSPQGFYVSTAFLRLRISLITFSTPIAVLSMA